MHVQRIILKDKVINDPKMISFIEHSLWEINGFPETNKNLEKAHVWIQADEAYKALIKADDNKLDILNLDSIDSGVLKVICTVVVDTLQHYEDLEIIMVIDHKRAIQTIKNI